jgi:mannobiose 2-epimerase
LADDQVAPVEAKDKQLVTQSRMVWGFSHVHLKGLSDGEHDYLGAARQGFEFLEEHFLDTEHGGYYWKTDLAGSPVVRCKFLYGQSFVVYAWVEYYRASQDERALAAARRLFRVLQEKLHDAEHGGWREHTEADWAPLQPGDPRNAVEVVGFKSANAHLHWMEALAELYDAWPNAEVRAALEEALRVNRRHFYPRDAGRSCLHRNPDWTEVTAASSAGLSYGHNVEFAWLMIRAQEVLGERPDWVHFRAHLDHALRHGTDRKGGGLYATGQGNEPANDTRKVWWAQAEWLAALTDALKQKENEAYAQALSRLIDFVWKYQVDPEDGIWLDTVSADGKPLRTGKAHNWKANYHDVRGVLKFIGAFGEKE